MNQYPSFFKNDSLFTPLLTDAWDRFTRDHRPRGSQEAWNSEDLLPSCEVHENEKSFEVKAELPGFKKEDIKIDLENNRLTVRAERKDERKGDNAKKHFSEFRYGAFSRTISFPSQVDAERTAAEYRDGVLSIHVTKANQGTTSKTIGIRSG